MSFLEEEYDRKYNRESDEDESDAESEDSDMEMRKPKIKIHNDDVVLDEQDQDPDIDDIDDDQDDQDNNSDDDEPDIFSDNREPKTTSSDLARAFSFENDNLSDNDLSDNEDEDDDDDDANYLQKFDENIQKEIIQEYHPEMIMHNYQEVEALSKITRDENGIVIDTLHRTLPFITRYEYARVLGERAKQINAGAKPFVSVSDSGFIDGYLIALEEYKQKKIPFIIKRPLPNGGCEYWPLRDLENIV